MANGDLVRLGTVYVDKSKIEVPSRPWSPLYSFVKDGITRNEGNIINFGFGCVEVMDSDKDDAYKIPWREVNINSKKLLIADRSLIIISYNDLQEQKLISGKKIQIDNKQYIIRILTNEEWDKIIVNDANLQGIPKPTNRDTLQDYHTDIELCREKFDGEHNKFWNWYSKENIVDHPHDNGTTHTTRGNYSVKYISNDNKNQHNCGWRPVLEVLNSPPDISDIDKNLGDKNGAFSVSYQVGDTDNDTLTIVEKLNGNILRTLNNAPKGQDITINITQEQLYLLPLNQENKITIEVNDSKGGISYRNYTFRRTNTPPVISNADKNLGVITAIGEKYTVTDAEGNAITIVEKLDNTVLRTFNVETGKEYATTIDKDTWVRLKNGQHKYTIEATDSNNSKSIRVFSFIKNETRINFTLVKPFTTDIKASKILVTPSWEIAGATVKVEACNNALDVNPVWEDITKQVLINRHYNFTNTIKTADKWGVNIRFTIEKDPTATNEICIKGFGGAFE